ncbi:tartronate semialdehyde reductase [Alicycliphilus denitrificans]|mgnify:CR=1 FL=1|uniref:NAD(P)-dependent oxidoreductase n=1 Tax=Alicycliphilus denitrificans TaxID=179636 RepID=UPI0009648640|nr:NAD(P)-dependent oxidoreductase [Alicycliphilus denitrificans]OJW91351.1 MAG: hypothetical protein BGO66_10655 [Alicycliphilus sp. 69-12]BCN38225.1 tartronate semialdehyde reductase [Alicycliphilus denitrificans]
MNKRIGLIGLGLMGRGMGHSLLRTGHPLCVLPHRRQDVACELEELGAEVADSVADLARRVDMLVTCLPSQAAVQEVLLGAEGVATHGRAGLLVVECSTLTSTAAHALAGPLRARDIGFVDAPLTGGPNEALAGQLVALIGGDIPAEVERAQALLGNFCRQSFRFPGTGQGYAAKLINNFLAFSQLAAIAEALPTAVKAGLEMDTLLAMIQQSGGQSRCLAGLQPWLTGRGESRSRVTLATAAKDVDAYWQLAASVGNAGPVADSVRERFRQSLADGLGDSLTPCYISHQACKVGTQIPPTAPPPSA